MVSLSVKSKDYLVKNGYTVEKTEHYNYFTKRRTDLLGIADLIALDGKDILLVQVTSRGNILARSKKAKNEVKLRLWMAAGGKFEIHGWDKYKSRWRLKRVNIDNKEI